MNEVLELKHLKKYYNDINGINSRMDEIQASMLKVALKYLDEGNEERIRIAKRSNYSLWLQRALQVSFRRRI